MLNTILHCVVWSLRRLHPPPAARARSLPAWSFQPHNRAGGGGGFELAFLACLEQVSVCACIYIHTDVYIYVQIYLFIYTYVYICIYTHVYMSMYLKFVS